MIKLTKLDEPAILRNSSEAWTQVLLDHLAAGTKATDTEKSRYRHPDIKAVLVRETNGKCAYCESKLLHAAYGDVEHIVPKSAAVEVTFKWGNLTIACDICNTNKGSNFGNAIDFVDPYVQEPADHFNVVGPLIFAKAGNDSARLTEETLKLNRSELVERREQRIRSLRDQAEVIQRAPINLRPILIDNFNEEILSDKEFAAIARGCLEMLLA